MRLPVRGDAHVYTLFSCAAVLTLLMLLPGAVITAHYSAPPDDEAIAAKHRTIFEANRRLLTKTMRSYAVVDDGRKPALDIHVFGLPGAPSLNEELESQLLAVLKSSGGFAGKKAFAPPQTAPGHRWPTASFAAASSDAAASSSPESSTQAETPDTGKTHPRTDSRALKINNEVIVAGGRFLITALRQHSPQPQTRLLLTDLRRGTTVDARSLFAADVDPATVSADDTGALTIAGRLADDTELTSLGQTVAKGLHTRLELSPPDDQRSPDFSCSLLPCVALTYDDGPGEAHTEASILAAADDAGIRVTYFFLGANIHTSPKVAHKVIAAGHEVDNHTYRHPRLDELPSAEVRREIRRTNKSLAAVGVADHPLVRPPYGALDKRSAHAVGGPSIIWDVDTGDWQSKRPKKIIARVKADTRPGSIVLMHSIHPATAKAAPDVFETVAKKGLYAVTVRELFADIPWQKSGSYFCRGYDDELCSNPEHPSVQKN